MSVISEGELLVRPEMHKDAGAIERIGDLLSEDGFYVIHADRRIARRAAKIRAAALLERSGKRATADKKMHMADAIIIATAIETGCDAIVGNDGAWRGQTEVPFVYLEDVTS